MLPNGCDYALWLKRIFFGGRVLLRRVEGYDLFTPEQMKKALWTWTALGFPSSKEIKKKQF